MKRIFLSFTLTLFLLMGNTPAQDKGAELDRLFSFYNENGMFNGVVLAAEDGNVVYEKAFGFSDFEKKTPMTISSIFAIGSTTKTFTALAVMMLKERGLLSYGDKIRKYLPELPATMNPITIRHLLTHTSGIIDYLNDLDLAAKLPAITTPIAMDALKGRPALEFKPGQRYEYSNSNYLLLALIVQKVSRMKYGDFLRKNVFTPIGMEHTYVDDKSEGGIPSRLKSYTGFEWSEADEDRRVMTVGDGGIYSTARDLLLFDQALYTEKLVSQQTLQAAYDDKGLLDRKKYVYGFGWKISLDTPDRVVSHNGATAGFRCQFWRDLDKKSTLIVLANTWWLSQTPDILSGAENIMLGKPYALGKTDGTILFYDTWYFNGFAAAMKALREAHAKTPGRYGFKPYLLHGLGYYFFFQEKKQIPEALEILRFSVGLFPNNPILWDTLGEVYLAASDREKAIPCYRKALELDPSSESSKEALYKLGVISQ